MTAAPNPPNTEDLSGSYKPVTHAEWLDAQEEARRNDKHRHDLKQDAEERQTRRQEDKEERRTRRLQEWVILVGLLIAGAAMVTAGLFQPAASTWLAGLAGSCFGFVGQRFIGKAGGGK